MVTGKHGKSVANRDESGRFPDGTNAPERVEPFAVSTDGPMAARNKGCGMGNRTVNTWGIIGYLGARTIESVYTDSREEKR
jgi:hypothetical protein